jgi:hypothetical protein
MTVQTEKRLVRIADWGVTEETLIFGDAFVLGGFYRLCSVYRLEETVIGGRTPDIV